MYIEELPEFSGTMPTCPKCGSRGAHTKYNKTGSCTFNGEGDHTRIENNEHNEFLCRTCGTCDYGWHEKVLPS